MKTITLHNSSLLALCDDEDYEYLNQFKWLLHSEGYALRWEHSKGILMHREVLNAPKGMDVDHINRNRLDNQKSNIRLATRSQNHMNMNRVGRTSIYKGVDSHYEIRKWRARICSEQMQVNIGCFKEERHAAMAYDLNAMVLFGEYANLNFQGDAVKSFCHS